MDETKQSIDLFWQEFLTKSSADLADTTYEAWAFGDSPEMADELLDLVLKGIKTGTAGSYDSYLEDNDPLPEVGSYSICLSGDGRPKCIIQTLAVKTVKFKDITEEDAYKEGEGDRTLAYWRRVHQAFWEREHAEYSLSFSPEMLVVYEEFKVVYSPE